MGDPVTDHVYALISPVEDIGLDVPMYANRQLAEAEAERRNATPQAEHGFRTDWQVVEVDLIGCEP